MMPFSQTLCWYEINKRFTDDKTGDLQGPTLAPSTCQMSKSLLKVVEMRRDELTENYILCCTDCTLVVIHNGR